MRIIIFLLFFFLISCGKKATNNTQIQVEKTEMSIETVHPSFAKISIEFKKDIENWNEFNVLNNFMARFLKASPKAVLSNSMELKSLVKSFKSAEKLALLNTPSFETRIDILYNETLRLADMSTIPAITANEVNVQIEKIIEAFSAVVQKINTSFLKKKFEDEITIDVNLIGLDTTKIDTLSKKIFYKKLDNKILPKHQ